jgi:predicted NAD-dependent protein-ADP-ribosyltransferase YbiA (DUF1768 family)
MWRHMCAAIAAVSLTAGCAWFHGEPVTAQVDASRAGYPAHWWTPVPEAEAAWWEVLPQAAGPGEVILSKRNELGLLSNFAHTPFDFHGVHYESLEGFWQMMLYPEGPDDPRAQFPGITWPHTRQEVSQMVGFEAKAAGDAAYENMQRMGINWVTFAGRRMEYMTPERGEHFHLIVEAMWAKVRQNPEVRDVLLRTGDLILRPDHVQPDDAPPSWRYFEIWMEIREALRREGQ